jgi:hypothetical protein
MQQLLFCFVLFFVRNQTHIAAKLFQMTRKIKFSILDSNLLHNIPNIILYYKLKSSIHTTILLYYGNNL